MTGLNVNDTGWKPQYESIHLPNSNESVSYMLAEEYIYARQHGEEYGQPDWYMEEGDLMYEAKQSMVN